jgi:hypothetical protein
MKMATPIPEETTTQDRVETLIATLNFKNGRLNGAVQQSADGQRVFTLDQKLQKTRPPAGDRPRLEETGSLARGVDLHGQGDEMLSWKMNRRSTK